MKQRLSFLLLLIVTNCFSQSSETLNGPVATSTGNTTLSQEWAVINNPAAIFEVKNPLLFTGYENKLGLKELNKVAAGASYPTARHGYYGFYLGSFGGDLFNISRAAISISHGIGKFNLGTRINIIQIQIAELGSRRAISLDIGGLAKITEKLSFGAYISNLNQAHYSKESKEKIPTIMAAGIGIKPFEKVFLSLEIEKSGENKANLKPGIQYHIIKNFTLRTGISSKPFRQSYGLGFQPKRFSFDYSLTNHNYLGLSHQIAISFNLKKKK